MMMMMVTDGNSNNNNNNKENVMQVVLEDKKNTTSSSVHFVDVAKSTLTKSPQRRVLQERDSNIMPQMTKSSVRFQLPTKDPEVHSKTPIVSYSLLLGNSDKFRDEIGEDESDRHVVNASTRVRFAGHTPHPQHYPKDDEDDSIIEPHEEQPQPICDVLSHYNFDLESFHHPAKMDQGATSDIHSNDNEADRNIVGYSTDHSQAPSSIDIAHPQPLHQLINSDSNINGNSSRQSTSSREAELLEGESQTLTLPSDSLQHTEVVQHALVDMLAIYWSPDSRNVTNSTAKHQSTSQVTTNNQDVDRFFDNYFCTDMASYAGGSTSHAKETKYTSNADMTDPPVQKSATMATLPNKVTVTNEDDIFGISLSKPNLLSRQSKQRTVQPSPSDVIITKATMPVSVPMMLIKPLEELNCPLDADSFVQKPAPIGKENQLKSHQPLNESSMNVLTGTVIDDLQSAFDSFKVDVATVKSMASEDDKAFVIFDHTKNETLLEPVGLDVLLKKKTVDVAKTTTSLTPASVPTQRIQKEPRPPITPMTSDMIRIPPLPYSIHLKRSQLSTPLLQKFGEPIRILNQKIDYSFTANERDFHVDDDYSKQINKNFGRNAVQNKKEVMQEKSFDFMEDELVEKRQSSLCSHQFDMTGDSDNDNNNDNEDACMSSIDNASGRSGTWSEEGIVPSHNYATEREFATKEFIKKEGPLAVANKSQMNKSQLLFESCNFSVLSTVTLDIEPTDSVPRLAMKHVRRKLTEKSDVKEICLKTTVGSSIESFLVFTNKKAEKLIVGAYTMMSRFEPIDRALPEQVEINNVFLLSDSRLIVHQNEEVKLKIMFKPTHTIPGVYSGVLKIQSPHQSFVLLLRGTTTENALAQPMKQLPPTSMASTSCTPVEREVCFQTKALQTNNTPSQQSMLQHEIFSPESENLRRKQALLKTQLYSLHKRVHEPSSSQKTTERHLGQPELAKGTTLLSEVAVESKKTNQAAETKIFSISSHQKIFFRKSTANFGSVDAGTLTRMRLELCNSSDEAMRVVISDPTLPFVLLHNEVTIRPRSYIRLPVRFVPISSGKQFTSELVAQAENSDQQTVIKLVGSSY